MVSRARSKSAWVFSVFKSRDAYVMLTLYKALVRSLLEYCCPLWHPKKISDIEAIEGVQREFTSRITGCWSLSYWERLKKLNLMSLQRRRERYILINMWRVLHRRIPNDLHIEFRPPSRLGTRAKVPGLRRNGRQVNQSLYDSSFAVSGPTLWNVLPTALTEINCEVGFKMKLTAYLSGLPDEPPVRGYQRARNNSLTEVGKRDRRWSQK
jgi:hypothetical protein